MEWLCFNGLLAAINGERQLCITNKSGVGHLFSLTQKLPCKCQKIVSDRFPLQFDTFLLFLLVCLFVFPHSFSLFSAEDCIADEPDNFIVPIAVGVALAVLVFIVLLAYLIGRKRSQTSGYEQFDS